MSEPKKIAVIGSGVAGLVSAWLLDRRYQVTLFEADERLGGHTHTHRISTPAGELNVDTGFIVHTPVSYPLFAKVLDTLGVATQPTEMTFSVSAPADHLEYNAGSLRQIFAQPRNLMRPQFFRMLKDIIRFFRDAKVLLESGFDEQPLGPFLRQRGYSDWFIRYHLNPMVAALWSASPAAVENFPARFLARFMRDHFMLQATGRPQWRVIKGGSNSYVSAMAKEFKGQIHCNTPVHALRRDSEGVEISFADNRIERFDRAIVACHSDQALGLLADADPREKQLLGAIKYQQNETVLHTDQRLLPKRQRAWAAWNAFVPATVGSDVTVTYNMNILQSLQTSDPVCVTLNRSQEIDPARVHAKVLYHHPIFCVDAARAQKHLAKINGVRNTWFCGAWTGFGFHEDGVRSAVNAAEQLGVKL